MSKPVRICLVGASGLVGTALIAACVGRTDLRLVAVARRELSLPRGATMEVLLAEPEHWADAIAAARPDVVVCALGTTRAKVNGDEAAFRAVDHDLVLDCARWAVEAGARQFIVVSSVGADPHARNAYLRIKGETEAALARTGQGRLDILQPSLLLGPRAERRPAETVARALAFLAPLLLHGGARRFRPIHGAALAEVILALVQQKARGRFVHDHDGMLRVVRRHAFERSLGVSEAVD